MQKKFALVLSIVFVLSLFAAAAAAQAQSEGLTLRIQKVFGYGSLGNREFQGVLKVTARGPEDLQRVAFFIDGEALAEVDGPPFEVRFDTGSFSLGEHTVTGVGYTGAGQELASQPLTVRFVTAQAGMQRGLSIVLPLLVVVFGAMLLSFVVPLVLSRGKKLETPLGAERKYGVAGGAVCSRCGRPFRLNVFSPNLGPVHRLARCPYCGKFGLMRRRSLQELRQAEADELELAPGAGPAALTEEEKLRRELEDSKYHNV